MSNPLTLDLSYLSEVVPEQEVAALSPRVQVALKTLLDKTGRGSDYLGWIDLPFTVEDQLSKIQKSAKRLSSICDNIISIGIGGSYLGIRSTIEALGGSPKIHYAGNQLSP